MVMAGPSPARPPQSPLVADSAAGPTAPTRAQTTPSQSTNRIGRPPTPAIRGRMLLRDRDGYGAVHSLLFTLNLGRQGQRPVSRHFRLSLDLINPTIGCSDRLHGSRHAGHPLRPHIEFGLDDDGARHGFAVGH